MKSRPSGEAGKRDSLQNCYTPVRARPGSHFSFLRRNVLVSTSFLRLKIFPRQIINPLPVFFAFINHKIKEGDSAYASLTLKKFAKITPLPFYKFQGLCFFFCRQYCNKDYGT